MLLSSLRARDRRPELMDDPTLPADEHRRALAGLARINRWTNSAGLLWRPLHRLARTRNRPIRVLDIATGSGDIPLTLFRKAENAGLAIDISGCDISSTAVATAIQAACRHCRGDQRPQFFVHDVLRDPLPAGYDAVTCSLFVHHLDEANAVLLFRRMMAATTGLVLVNDLARSRFNYCAVWLVSRLLSRSPVVHTDGPLSVQAALTVRELGALAEEAGLTGARVSGQFPCRQVLHWEKT